MTTLQESLSNAAYFRKVDSWYTYRLTPGQPCHLSPICVAKDPFCGRRLRRRCGATRSASAGIAHRGQRPLLQRFFAALLKSMKTPTRQRLIEAAIRRFYRDGFRNVGIDQ